MLCPILIMLTKFLKLNLQRKDSFRKILNTFVTDKWGPPNLIKVLIPVYTILNING